MSGDFFSFVSEFHSKEHFPKAIYAFFIALVPKVDNPQLFRDYRPVSIVFSLHKIIAKLLANRLKKVVGELVSSTQTTFIPGGQIRECLLLKVVFEKTHNNVN